MNSSENQVKRLTVDQIEVPEGMFQAARLGVYPRSSEELTHNLLAAALLWLAENPIVPSALQSRELRSAAQDAFRQRAVSTEDWITFYSAEWLRCMFLRKQEELPDEVKELLVKNLHNSDFINEKIRAAYKLGKSEGK